LTPPEGRRPGPAGVTALSVFFAAGAAIALLSLVSLLVPSGALEPMWRLNPRAHEGFTRLGTGTIALLAGVSAACAAAAVGVWRGRRWGHVLELGLLTVNLLGDILNVTLGTERRAAIGIPIAGAIIVYLCTGRPRRFFTGKNRET